MEIAHHFHVTNALLGSPSEFPGFYPNSLVSAMAPPGFCPNSLVSTIAPWFLSPLLVCSSPFSVSQIWLACRTATLNCVRVGDHLMFAVRRFVLGPPSGVLLECLAQFLTTLTLLPLQGRSTATCPLTTSENGSFLLKTNL